jgi:hypothetical protein
LFGVIPALKHLNWKKMEDKIKCRCGAYMHKREVININQKVFLCSNCHLAWSPSFWNTEKGSFIYLPDGTKKFAKDFFYPIVEVVI